jgi:hypothetical protein
MQAALHRKAHYDFPRALCKAAMASFEIARGFSNRMGQFSLYTFPIPIESIYRVSMRFRMFF